MSEQLKRDFEVLEEIGRGRFGRVFRCVSPDSGQSFAVKSIDKGLLEDPIDRECIENEAKLLQIVGNHPNVILLQAVYEDESFLHLVMEICLGQDLYDKVADHPVSEQEAAGIMAQLMEAVAHCHSRGVAHRDIKPENVLFDGRSRLKLADFGSADCFYGGSMRGVVGTPYYVAPEVLLGLDYGEKVDIWSCGVVLYVLLGGEPPFSGESPADIFAAVLRGNLRFPFRKFVGISTSAKDLMRRMLCKDPAKRYTAEQVLRHPWITSGGEQRTMVDMT
ncbi:hypothetical protein AMTRI_Chr07g23910 [Amborella trichopoda]